MKNKLKKLYYFYQIPGFILHEASHLFMFWLLKILFWPWAEYKHFKWSVTHRKCCGNLDYSLAEKPIGHYFTILVAVAPWIMYFVIFILLYYLNSLVLLIYSLYSLTTVWFKLSELDSNSLEIACYSIRNRKK